MDGARAAGDAILAPDDARTHATAANAVGDAGWNGGTGRKLEAGVKSVAAATRNGAAGAVNGVDSEWKTADGATAINAPVTNVTETNATATATNAIVTAINGIGIAIAAPTDDAPDGIDETGQHGEKWRSGAAAAVSNGEIAAIRDGHHETVECAADWTELSEWQPDELDNLMIYCHVCSPRNKREILIKFELIVKEKLYIRGYIFLSNQKELFVTHIRKPFKL